MRLNGQKDLAARVKKLNSGMRQQVIRKAGMTAGMVIEGRTKVKAPVRTGALRNSYNTTVVESTENTIKVEVATNIEYAEAVEFGTSRQSAQPHLRPSFDESKVEVTQVFTRAVIAAIEEVT